MFDQNEKISTFGSEVFKQRSRLLHITISVLEHCPKTSVASPASTPTVVSHGNRNLIGVASQHLTGFVGNMGTQEPIMRMSVPFIFSTAGQPKGVPALRMRERRVAGIDAHDCSGNAGSVDYTGKNSRMLGPLFFSAVQRLTDFGREVVAAEGLLDKMNPAV